MKNILIVSDYFSDGGLETRVIDEIRAFKQKKYNIYLACNYVVPKYRIYFEDILILNNLYINNIISLQLIKKTRDQISVFCKKKAIDHIECHPFAHALPAILAANESNTPITYTIHGITSGNFIDPQQTQLKTLYYLALRYGLDQIFAVAEYLQEMYSYLSPKILIARNGMNMKKQENRSPRDDSPSGQFAIASRLDPIKTQLIMDFIPSIHNLSQVKQIDILGDGTEKENLQTFINVNHYSKVKLQGWVNDPIALIKQCNYDALFGMGRVMLDAFCTKTPAGVLGYKGFAGFINDTNIQHFAKTNLTSWQTVPNQQLASSIKDIQKNKNRYILSQESLRLFDNKANLHDYIETNRKISYSPKPIITKINHVLEKINDLTEFSDLFNPYFDNTFDPHHQTLTIQYYQDNTISNLQKEISNLQKENSNLQKENVKKVDELQSIKSELVEITTSKFWKTTKPIRNLLSKIHQKKANNNAEIIAVICTYNEQLNITGCLNHLEKYVDKIVLFDDGSTDNTVQIAEKHKKVVKIIKNDNKTKWDEKKNREIVIREAYSISNNKNNTWVLCVDADERFETNFLYQLRTIINKHLNDNLVINVHFRELWDSINQYRNDGIWNQKKKGVLFKLSDKMTFNFHQEHHIPWHYQELNDKEVLLNFNLYHLKMVRKKDRAQRVKLYNTLDPNKEMQPIGYDYLTDTTNLNLKTIPRNKNYDHSTVPDYYRI